MWGRQESVCAIIGVIISLAALSNGFRQRDRMGNDHTVTTGIRHLLALRA